jgi:1-acyl-sn-glycerol-3-phosphate acyltransferase
MNLTVAGLGPQTRRLLRAVGERAYAAWWWSVVAVLGAFLWPAVLALPRLDWRWALMHRTASLGFRLMGIPLRVTGPWPPPQRSIVVINHSSYLDGLVLAAALSGELAFVAKKELEAQFFAGHFLRALGALFVERVDPEGGVEDARKAHLAAEAGRVLVFFPEGTFTRAPGVLSFRMGAFVTAAKQNLAILPVAVRGTRSILRSDQWFPRHGAITVWIDEPIAPQGSDFAAALRLRERARAAIIAHCGEPDVSEN